MLLLTLFLGIAHLSFLANCKPVKRWGDLAVKHSWIEPPKGWKYHTPAPADYVLDLRIGLKQPRIDELIAHLMEISDPAHSRYAQHLTKEQVEELTRAHPDSIRVIDEWLLFHGINPSGSSALTKTGDWVTIKVTVEQAERMLGTKYYVYKHTLSGDQAVRTLSYSVPSELLSHIDVIAPTTYFGTIRSMKSTSFLSPHPSSGLDLSDSFPCSEAYVTLGCLRSMYHTEGYIPQSTKTNKLGVVGYLNQFANYADLKTFFQKFRPEAVGSNFTTVLVHDGGDNQNDPGIEANLDIQYTTGITYPTPNIYYSTGGSPPYIGDSVTTSNTNEPYLDFLDYIMSLNSTALPQVLTTSYGDDEQTVPMEYAVSVCNRFAALGARGTTVFFSSGDSGVGGGDCKTNDGSDRTLFQPMFPASCPFVTTVGGTTGYPESAALFSGGGFSRYFPRLSYQNATVNKYVARLGDEYKGMYNSKGRAYPDISAQSMDFQVIIGGKEESVDGTSASSPTVAAIFSLLNDLRLSSGKKSLGFINPLIYSTASSGFNDILFGSNPGCGTDGFLAGLGWDPVTGLGTPDFSKLRSLV